MERMENMRDSEEMKQSLSTLAKLDFESMLETQHTWVTLARTEMMADT